MESGAREWGGWALGLLARPHTVAAADLASDPDRDPLPLVAEVAKP